MKKFILLVTLILCSVAVADTLRQSTSAKIGLWPIVDLAGDIYTTQIPPRFIETWKFGRSGFVSYHAATAVTPDANGWAWVTLDTNDTATANTLIVAILDPNISPISKENEVVAAAWYDAMYTAAKLPVNDGNDATIIAKTNLIPSSLTNLSVRAAGSVFLDPNYNAAKNAASQTSVDANGTAIKAKTNQLQFAADGDVKAWDSNSLSDKTGYKLASDGLDTIARTQSTGEPNNWNFRQRVNWLVARFYNEATKTSTTLTVKDSNGTAITAQTVSDDGSTQTVGKTKAP